MVFGGFLGGLRHLKPRIMDHADWNALRRFVLVDEHQLWQFHQANLDKIRWSFTGIFPLSAWFALRSKSRQPASQHEYHVTDNMSKMFGMVRPTPHCLNQLVAVQRHGYDNEVISEKPQGYSFPKAFHHSRVLLLEEINWFYHRFIPVQINPFKGFELTCQTNTWYCHGPGQRQADSNTVENKNDSDNKKKHDLECYGRTEHWTKIALNLVYSWGVF